jgi:outer membrane protein OmpA-like peptidoglycan-associated protein
LADSVAYSIHIEQFGYEPYNGIVSNLGDSMHIDLIPIKQEVIILKNMFFATNKTKILPMSEPELNGLYNFLESHPNVRIKIVGHTDNTGSEAINKSLSLKRAESAKAYLVKKGVNGSQITTEGAAASKPIVCNDDAASRAKNRRIEVSVTK